MPRPDLIPELMTVERVRELSRRDVSIADGARAAYEESFTAQGDLDMRALRRNLSEIAKGKASYTHEWATMREPARQAQVQQLTQAYNLAVRALVMEVATPGRLTLLARELGLSTPLEHCDVPAGFNPTDLTTSMEKAGVTCKKLGGQSR